jgi:UDP-N-acetylmuramoyl-L-alanyl-D-glutamate--2,6-diaminopimelate ligase
MRLYQQLKNFYHFGQAHAWRTYYAWPDRKLKIYGVTGTNGKTTTCYVLAGILGEAYERKKAGMLSTVAFWIGEEEEINKTKMTTLDSRFVFKNLRRMVNKGVEQVAFEVTSHALDQNRLSGIRLDGAIILNMAREHLNYHGTMEEYAKAKGKIVEYLKPEAPLVIKGDDELIEKAIKAPKAIRFTSLQAKEVITPLSGEWNKENVLAASLLARAVGVDEGAIERGVDLMKEVPGRMEWINLNNQLPRVLIDYAVTPDALQRLYGHVKKRVSGRIFAVLGAAGLRDRGKRPLMTQAVAKYADEIVLTREDPWTEPEKQIFNDLEKGLNDSRVKWQRIVDRKEALKYVLKKAQAGDVVVVTGKGAEKGMAIGNKIIPWNDKEVIQQLFIELGLND